MDFWIFALKKEFGVDLKMTVFLADLTRAMIAQNR
jgi:hypothetical protein